MFHQFGHQVVEFGVGAGAGCLHHRESPLSVEEVDFGQFGAEFQFQFLPVLDVGYFGHFHAGLLDVALESAYYVVEYFGHMHHRFLFGGPLAAELEGPLYPVEGFLVGVGRRRRGVIRRCRRIVSDGLFVADFRVEEFLRIAHVDVRGEVDGVGVGVEVSVGVGAYEAGPRHVRRLGVHHLLQAVLFAEFQREVLVEDGVQPRVVAPVLQVHHEFEPVAARRFEKQQGAGVGSEPALDFGHRQPLFGDVVNVDDEAFGVREVPAFAKGGGEHGAHEIGEGSFQFGVFRGVELPHYPQLPYPVGDVGFRVPYGVGDVLHRNLAELFGVVPYVGTYGNQAIHVS